MRGSKYNAVIEGSRDARPYKYVVRLYCGLARIDTGFADSRWGARREARRLARRYEKQQRRNGYRTEYRFG